MSFVRAVVLLALLAVALPGCKTATRNAAEPRDPALKDFAVATVPIPSMRFPGLSGEAREFARTCATRTVRFDLPMAPEEEPAPAPKGAKKSKKGKKAKKRKAPRAKVRYRAQVEAKGKRIELDAWKDFAGTPGQPGGETRIVHFEAKDTDGPYVAAKAYWSEAEGYRGEALARALATWLESGSRECPDLAKDRELP